MPRIPDSRQIGQARVQGAAPVARVDRSNLDFGVNAVASAVRQREALNRQKKLQSARVKAQQLIIEEESKFDEDPNWDTFEERNRAALDEGLGSILSGVEDQDDREALRNELQLDRTRSSARLRKAVLGKERDESRAGQNDILEQIRKNAATIGIVPAYEQARQLVETNKELGHVSAQEAQQQLSAYKDTLAIDHAERMKPDARLTWLEGNDAKNNLSPEIWRRLHDAAKREKETEDLTANSQIEADRIYSENPEDERAAYAAARKLPNGKLRDETLNRLKRRFGEEEQIAADEQRDVSEQGLGVLNDGGTFSDIPAEVRQAADARTEKFWLDIVHQREQRDLSRRTLSTQEKALAREQEKINKSVIESLSVLEPEAYLGGPAAWLTARPEFYARFASLGADEQQIILGDIAQKRQSGGEQSQVDKNYSLAIGEANRLLQDQDLNVDKDDDEYIEFMGHIRSRIADETAQIGDAAITAERVKTIVALAANDTQIKKGFFDPSRPRIRPLVEAPEVLQAADQEVTTKRRALDVLGNADVRPYALAARQSLADKGVESPSDIQLAREALRLKKKREVNQAIGGLVETVTGVFE